MTINGSSTDSLYDIVNQQYTDRVVKAAERVSTGLKINTTSDNSAAATIAISLGANSSSLLQGIENANEGLGLVSVSNKALSQQEEILNQIKDRLEFAKSADDSAKDIVRQDIQSLLEDFDNIAASTSYNSNFTLQQSATDTSESQAISLTLSNETEVNTDPIQSNSQGVNLSNLKNLNSQELTYETIVSELENVNSALNTVENYQESFALTQSELQISIGSLSNVQEGNEAAKEYLTTANLNEEQAIVDQYNTLVNSSQYAIVQANTTQERVLQLLTNIPEYEPSKDNKDSTITRDEKDNSYDFTQKTINSYTYEPKVDNNSSFNTNSFTRDDS